MSENPYAERSTVASAAAAPGGRDPARRQPARISGAGQRRRAGRPRSGRPGQGGDRRQVDGRPRDLATVIDHDAAVAIITRDMPEGVEILRHDAAHVMAEAVKELYPETQVTFGPATETGFYYDFARETPFTPEDLARIEERMREIVRRDETITREVWDRDRAIAFFAGIGERYKAEYIGEIPPARRSASIARAISSICASGRICRRPAGSGKPSS